jgi:RHS repeat-associated protein
VPARVTATTYESAPQGRVKEDVADPGAAPHLNLVTTTAYEPAGLRRPVSHTLPGGDVANANTATGFTYYASTEARDNPCTPAADPANQAGRLRTDTAPSPDGTSAGRLAREVAYDEAGRVVASHAGPGSEAWSCNYYNDARGRITSATYPAYGGEGGHIFTYDYAVGGNPLVRRASEGSAAITTTVDLLGRVISYTDTWAKTTTSSYDQAGRPTATTGPAGTTGTTYDPAGRTKTQSLDGALMATAAYNAVGELASVSYASALNGGNGSSLAAIARHPTGMVSGLTWTGTGASALATDVVGRSQSGKVVDETVDGVDAYPGGANFTYDGAGRLVQARIPGQSLAYGFATASGCGPQSAPGRNTNRSSVTVNTGIPTNYCYDQADRLVSSTDPAVGTPSYDSHGSTTTLGSETLIYDGADRHVETKVNASTVVRYQRDATGRITSRTEGSTVTHYGYAGPGDSAAFTMDATNNVTERTIGLVGGVIVTKRGGLLGAGDVWSYPNVHGDVVATADNTGVKQGTTKTYDPFGQALAGLPDNSAGNLDYGWLGQHERPTEHASGMLPTLEMGARPYLPAIGRFLRVDPVEGGSANDYDYSNGDPVNGLDLDGLSKKRALPNLDGKCLAGGYLDLTSPECERYRLAKLEGDSDYYYNPRKSVNESHGDIISRNANLKSAAAFVRCANYVYQITSSEVDAGRNAILIAFGPPPIAQAAGAGGLAYDIATIRSNKRAFDRRCK